MSLFRRGPTEPQASNPQDAPGESPADETARTEETSGEVPGERGIPSVNRVRTVQSRVSSVLTVSLMGALAVGLLIWYYSGAFNRNARAQQLAEANRPIVLTTGKSQRDQINGSGSPSGSCRL